MTELKDSDRTVVVAFYAAARAEIVQRLAMREQVLLAAVALYGAIAALALRADAPNVRLLLPIPLAAGPLIFAFARHDWIIRALGTYLAVELRALRYATGFLDWDGSRVLATERRYFLPMERLVCGGLIAGPAAVVLWHTWPGPLSMQRPMDTNYLFALLSTSLGVAYFIHEARRLSRPPAGGDAAPAARDRSSGGALDDESVPKAASGGVDRVESNQ